MSRANGPCLALQGAVAPDRKQINVVRDVLGDWCTCVMRSKVEPMKGVAALVRRHLEGVVHGRRRDRPTASSKPSSTACSRQPSAAPARFTRLSTIRTVIFRIAGKLDFQAINAHAPQPT
jgi:hypothetical protein